MSEAAKQFAQEIRKVILRSAMESDITVGEIAGMLEVEKFNFLRNQEEGQNDKLEEGSKDDETN